MKRKRFVDADGPGSECDVGTVRAGGRARDEHLARRDDTSRAHVVAGVVHVLGVRSVEMIRPAGKAPAELEREIERHVAGDVRRPILAIEPSREVQPIDVHRARAVPAGHRRVEHERAAHRSAGRLQGERGVQPRERTFERRVEGGVDRDVLQPADDARPFLKREARRVDLQIERRRRVAADDVAGEVKVVVGVCTAKS